MTTYKTGNPLGSAAAKDLFDNAQNLDTAVNSNDKTWIDRFGRTRRTMAGIDYDANQAMLKYGYITKKSFELGATLDTPNTVLQWESDGEFYRWDGDWSAPKVVPAGSTPDATGGIGTGKWVGVGDAALRGEITAESGAFLIGRPGGGTVADTMPAKADITLNVPDDFSSLSEALMFLHDRRFPDYAVTINVAAGIYTESATLPTAHIDGENIAIIGAHDTLSITSISSVTGATFSVKHWDGVTKNLNYQTVTGTASGEVPAVGEFILIQSASGADTAEYHLGAWEVTAVSGNQVTWITTLNAAPPSGAVTLSGRILRTVITFLDGAKGPTAIQVENSLSLGLVDGMAIVGAAAPVAIGNRGPANYDVYGGEGGNTGVVARDGGVLNLGSNIGVSGFSGSNVYANRSGTIVAGTGAASSNSARNGWGAASAVIQCASCIASGNLIDGIIAQDTAFTFATVSRSYGNHRHAYIAAAGASLNMTSSIGRGCIGSGMENINSQVLANGSVLTNNTGPAINNTGGVIRAPSCDLRNNGGVSTGLNGSTNITSSNLDGVAVTAISNGFIDVTGYSGTPTLSPVVNHYSIFGGFIANGTAQTFIGFSPNGTSSAMRLSATNHVWIGTAADLAGLSGARLHCNGPAVFGGDIYPSVDATNNVGSASLRMNIGFFAGGTQSSSDARLKTEVRAMTDAEISAAKKLPTLWDSGNGWMMSRKGSAPVQLCSQLSASWKPKVWTGRNTVLSDMTNGMMFMSRLCENCRTERQKKRGKRSWSKRLETFTSFATRS